MGDPLININIDNSNTVDDGITSMATSPALASEATFIKAVPNDPALWVINDSLIDYLSRNGFEQNIEGEDFAKSKRKADNRNRFLNKDLFKTKLINGENISRNYLIFRVPLGQYFAGLV